MNMAMRDLSTKAKPYITLGACAFGHYEFQNESINNAPKHRAVIGGGGR